MLCVVLLAGRVLGIGPQWSFPEVFGQEGRGSGSLEADSWTDVELAMGETESERVRAAERSRRRLGVDGELFGHLRDGGQAAFEAERIVELADRVMQSAEARVAALGRDNDSLFSDVGRSFVRRTLRIVEAVDLTQRRALLSRMFRSLATGQRGARHSQARTTLAEVRDLLSEVTDGLGADGRLEVLVEPGDTLSELLTRLEEETGRDINSKAFLAANGIRNPDRIRAGRKLVVPPDSVLIEVYVGARWVALVEDGLVLRSFLCSVSERAEVAAGGTFWIADQIEDPSWRHTDGRILAEGDPGNPLGSVFLALEDEEGDRTPFGLHGGRDPDSESLGVALGSVGLSEGDLSALRDFAQEGVEVRFLR